MFSHLLPPYLLFKITPTTSLILLGFIIVKSRHRLIFPELYPYTLICTLPPTSDNSPKTFFTMSSWSNPYSALFSSSHSNVRIFLSWCVWCTPTDTVSACFSTHTWGGGGFSCKVSYLKIKYIFLNIYNINYQLICNTDLCC